MQYTYIYIYIYIYIFIYIYIYGNQVVGIRHYYVQSDWSKQCAYF